MSRQDLRNRKRAAKNARLRGPIGNDLMFKEWRECRNMPTGAPRRAEILRLLEKYGPRVVNREGALNIQYDTDLKKLLASKKIVRTRKHKTSFWNDGVRVTMISVNKG